MVESFLVEEVEPLISDQVQLDEWTELVDRLDLDEQKALASGQASPIPFVNMDAMSERIYKTLCPAKVEYKVYGKTAIPIRVLSLIALAEKEKYFKYIEIWYDDKSPDPIVVGYKDGQYSSEKHMIARWGDVLRSQKELTEMALDRLRDKYEVEIEKARQSLKVVTPDLLAKKFLNEGRANLDLPF